MKKMVSIGIAVFLVTAVATSAFAFDPNWGDHGRYDHQSGHAHKWTNSGHGYEGGKQGQYAGEQHYRHHEPYYRSGANIALPLVPLPGISFWFPGISVNVH